jgi:hypothetical protein
MLLVIAAVAAAYSCYQMIAVRGAKKEAGELRWVKPNFVSGGAVRRAWKGLWAIAQRMLRQVPLSIYSKIVVSHYQILTQVSSCQCWAFLHQLFRPGLTTAVLLNWFRGLTAVVPKQFYISKLTLTTI